MLDTYNQQIQEEVSCTIRTNINTANHHFVVEEPIIVAMRGREPQVLTPKRTEFGKAVRKQYENKELKMSRHDMTTMEPRTDGISNTLTSVHKDNYLAIPEATAKGFAEAYEGESVNLAVPNSQTRRGRVGKQMANTLDTGCQQGVVEKYNDISYGEKRVFKTINETNTREVLCLLRSKVGEKKIQWAIGRFFSILKEEVLRQGVCKESTSQSGNKQTDLHPSSQLIEEDYLSNRAEGDEVRDLRNDNEHRCASQGFQLSEQFTREFNDIMSQLSYEDSQTKECMLYLWRACEGTQSMQQTLAALEEVWQSSTPTLEYIQPQKYRIRKLTCRECFRLMGVDDKDIDTIQAAGISNSQQYKMAGNSIVVDTLYHLMRKLFVETDCEEKQYQQTLF
jgi:site-specific DNA-cytosine methylase